MKNAKKWIFVCFLAITMAIFAGCSASAEYTTMSDGTYSLSHALNITDKTSSYAVPATHEGKAVTNIGAGAFSNASALKTVTIPASIKSIDASAFYNCKKLEHVIYMGDVKSWCNISFGNSASNPLLYGASLTVDGEIMGELAIPYGVKEIKDYAFCGWSGSKVVIPTTVEKIGRCAFYNCKGLSRIAFYGDSAEWDRIKKGLLWSFKADYEVKYEKFTVSFDSGTILNIDEQKVLSGRKVTEPKDVPEKAGYTFAGWCLDGAAWDFKTDVVTEDITLEAKWTPKRYSIAYEDEEVSVTYGQAYELPSDLMKTGYTFIGYKLDGSGFPVEGVYNYTNDIELEVIWEPNQYTIKYGDEELDVRYGEEYTLPDDLTKEGYTFGGYRYNQENFAGTGTYNYTSDIEVEIIWLSE